MHAWATTRHRGERLLAHVSRGHLNFTQAELPALSSPQACTTPLTPLPAIFHCLIPILLLLLLLLLSKPPLLLLRLLLGLRTW